MPYALRRNLAHRVCHSAAMRLRHYADRAHRRQIALELKALGLAGNITTWTSRAELEALYALARECPRGANIVEVGSYLGASTVYLAAGAADKEAHIICIDTWTNETIPGDDRDTFARFKDNVAGAAHRITAVRKRSNELLPSDLRLPIHLAFIDADHSYEATKADAAFLLPLMAPNGVVAFHDTSTFAGVSRALAEVLLAGEWCIGGHADHLSWIQLARWSPWPLHSDELPAEAKRA